MIARLLATRSVTRPADQAPAPAARPPADEAPAAHVRRLMILAELLETPVQAAERVAKLAHETLDAQAVAVLVPDEGKWALCVGIGTRPQEDRLRLQGDHWLVRESLRRRHVIVIEDTDIARARLNGSPLAHWKYLLAMPLLGAESLVIAARARGPFDVSRIGTFSDRIGDLDQPLKDALDTRDLARQLQSIYDR
jgi:hypothetical protein